MKTYEVELRRTSFVTVWIEAETEEEAEALVFERVNEEYTDAKYASWDVEYIREDETVNQGESK